MGYYIIMTLEAEGIKELLYQDYGLSVMQLHQRLNKVITTQEGLYAFISNNGY